MTLALSGPASLDSIRQMLEALHYRNLDAARGVAAQAVLLGHAHALLYDPQGSLVLGWFAKLAVIVFFVVSGFSIATSIRRGIEKTGRFDVFEYAVRRVARIYPPYLLAMLAVAVFAATIGLPGTDVSTVSWLRAVSFLYMNNDAMTIGDGPIWSLRIEVGLYVLTAVAALALLASGARRAALAAVTLALALLFCARQSYAPTAMALYGVGAVAAFWTDRLDLRIGGVLGAGIACLLLLPLAVPQLGELSPLPLIFQAVLGVPIMAVLLATRGFRFGDTAAARACVATGSWSYTLYIFHWPICLAIKAVAGEESVAAFVAAY